MSTLSLCMIVKDEEANLPRCLASVVGAVDEIIVVDTGSHDRTVEIARRFGAKVVEWAWRDDFAAARNVSLDHATGDWILFLDADEELLGEDHETLRGLMDEASHDGVFLLETNFAGERPGFDQVTSATLRFFRNRPEYRFAGAIHEQIMPAILAHGGRLGHSRVRLRHYGYLDEAIQAQDKVERNLRIATAEVAREPRNAFALFNLGMEYLRIHEHEKALEVNRRAFLHLPDLTVQYASRLLRNIVACLIALKRYGEAFKVLKDAVAAYPDFTDLFYQRGQIYLEQQDFPRAADAFRVCLEKGDADSRYISDTGVGSYRAHFGLGYALEMMGEYGPAMEAYQASLSKCSVLPGPANRLAKLLLSVIPADVVLLRLKPMIAEGDPTVLLGIAIAFRDARHYQDALRLVEMALGKEPLGPGLVMKGELLLHLGRFTDAAAILEEAMAAHQPAAAFAGLAHLLAGNAESADRCLCAAAKLPEERHCTVVFRAFASLLSEGGPAAPTRLRLERDVQPERLSEVVWLLLGLLLEQQAFAEFERALTLLDQLSLNDITRHLELGKLYHGFGYLESAIEELSQVPPERLDADAAEVLGNLCEQRNLFDEALGFFGAAAECDPANLRRHLLAVSKAQQLGRPQAAVELAKSALVRFPGHQALRRLAVSGRSGANVNPTQEDGKPLVDGSAGADTCGREVSS